MREWHIIEQNFVWERERGKQVLSDFISEKKNRKQTLLWKCCFEYSQNNVTCSGKRNKSFGRHFLFFTGFSIHGNLIQNIIPLLKKNTGSLAEWVECSPKTLKKKMVLDTSLLITQHYKVRIKGKEEQFRERSSVLPYTLV